MMTTIPIIEPYSLGSVSACSLFRLSGRCRPCFCRRCWKCGWFRHDWVLIFLVFCRRRSSCWLTPLCRGRHSCLDQTSQRSSPQLFLNPFQSSSFVIIIRIKQKFLNRENLIKSVLNIWSKFIYNLYCQIHFSYSQFNHSKCPTYSPSSCPSQPSNLKSLNFPNTHSIFCCLQTLLLPDNDFIFIFKYFPSSMIVFVRGLNQTH